MPGDSNRNLNTNIRVNGAAEAAGAMNRLAGEEAKLLKIKRELSNSAVNANGAIIALSRGVQDANYGIIGITNNIQQFGEAMGYLIVQSGGFRGAMTAVGSSLTGMGGALFAFSAVTTAIQYFSMQQQGAKKDVDDTTDSIIKQRNELEKLTREFLQSKLVGNQLELVKLTGDPNQLSSMNPVTRLLNFIGGGLSEEEEKRVKQLQDENRLIDDVLYRLGDMENIENRITKLKQDQNDLNAQNYKFLYPQAKSLQDAKNIVQEQLKISEKQLKVEQGKTEAYKSQKKTLEGLFNDIFLRISGSGKDGIGLTFASDTEEKLFKQSTDLMEKLKASFERQGLEWNEENREWAFNIAFSFGNTQDNKYKNLFHGKVSEFNSGFSGDKRPWDDWIEKSLKNDDNIKLAEDFADSFGDMMQAAGTSAFEKMFGEANSLGEIFISKFMSRWLDRETEGLMSGLFDWLPGGSVLGALFGGDKSAGKTVVQVTIGDKILQKTFDDYVPGAFNNGVRLRKIVLS